jgi:hypothetical protein
MVQPDASFTSPLRGEVDAHASGEGFSAVLCAVLFPDAELLTPTLSPQGRGGDRFARSAPLWETLHGLA